MDDVSPKYLAGFRAAVGANGSVRRNVVPVHGAATPDAAPDALSFEERVKRELHPLDAFSRLLDCAKTDRPPSADDGFRFRWFGLFYEGPSRDAFRLRLRLPGGRLPCFQLAALAEITQELAGGWLECNPQGGLDIPGIAVRVAVETLRRVNDIGLRTLLSGGDCVQAVRGGEYEGLLENSGPSTVGSLVLELEQAIAWDRGLADLPGPCEVSLRGLEASPASSQHETMTFQELAKPLLRATGADLGEVAQFTLAVPDGVATGIVLTASQVVPACLQLLRKWAGQDRRVDRRQVELANFCAEIGGERLRAWIGEAVGMLPEALTRDRLQSASTTVLPLGVLVPEGRLLSVALTRLAAVARDHGSNEVRLADGRVFIPRALDFSAARQSLLDALESR